MTEEIIEFLDPLDIAARLGLEGRTLFSSRCNFLRARRTLGTFWVASFISYRREGFRRLGGEDLRSPRETDGGGKRLS